MKKTLTKKVMFQSKVNIYLKHRKVEFLKFKKELFSKRNVYKSKRD